MVAADRPLPGAYDAGVDLVGRIVAAVLALVFAWAAGAKIATPSETADGFAELGLPAPVLLMRVVIGAEVFTALVLLMAPEWGGILAFALLAGFTVYLADLVRSGRPVTCRCFGGANVEPVSAKSLVRNGVLLVMAVVAATF